MAKIKIMIVVTIFSGCMLGLTGCPSAVDEMTKAAYAFVDENEDGICDTCGQGFDTDGDGVCDNYVDQDGDGICDNRQSHLHLGVGMTGYHFCDENGDGICDICGGQDANGDGICDNYVDQDGDGVCDNSQSHMQRGQTWRGNHLSNGNGNGA